VGQWPAEGEGKKKKKILHLITGRGGKKGDPLFRLIKINEKGKGLCSIFNGKGRKRVGSSVRVLESR